MKSSILLATTAAYLPCISAHYFFPHLIVNDNFTGYFEYVREDTQNYMPFKNGYTSTDFRCNTGSQDYAASTGVYNVKAGDTIGFGTDFNVEIAHPGPIQVYMSKAPGNVQDYDGSGDWFKVYELGPQEFSSDGIEWGATGVGNFTFTLPEETPAGQYLVRIEHIALHGAGDYGNAEFYFNCAQIEVESESTASPSPVVQFPGVYTGYEPGILFYMYRNYIVNYTMPGPVPWPNPVEPNITASGVSIAPTDATWTLPAVTNSMSATVSSLTTAAPSIASASALLNSSIPATLNSSFTLASISAEAQATTLSSSTQATQLLAQATKAACGSRKHRRSGRS